MTSKINTFSTVNTIEARFTVSMQSLQLLFYIKQLSSRSILLLVLDQSLQHVSGSNFWAIEMGMLLGSTDHQFLWPHTLLDHGENMARTPHSLVSNEDASSSE